MKKIPKLLQLPTEDNRKMVFEKIITHLKDEKIIKLKTNAVNICFMLDATGSMRKYIMLVKETIKEIVKIIKEISNVNDLSLKLGCCFYRDIHDDEKLGILCLTSSIEYFEKYLSSIETKGGNDQCEDVKLGFIGVNELDWNQNDLNFIFWIADAPCHGKKYHLEVVKDDYPNLKCNQKVEDELKKVAQKNVHFIFLKVNNSTDQMLKVFNDIYKQAGAKEIIQKKVKDNDHKQFIETIVKQYDKIQQTSSLHQVNYLYKNNKNILEDQTLSDYIKSYFLSSSILTLILDCAEKENNLGLFNITADKIQYLDDIQYGFIGEAIIKNYKINKNNESLLELSNEEVINLKISSKIIGRGSFKYCFFALNSTYGDTFALKLMFRKMSSLPKNILFEVYINQIAQKCLKAFQEMGDKCTNKSIRQKMNFFIPDLRICEANGNIYLIEKLLDKDKFKKIINNDGNILIKNNPKYQIFETFVHYSYIFSDKNFILTDIQGVDNNLVDIGINCQGLFQNFIEVYKRKLSKEKNPESFFQNEDQSLPIKIDLDNKDNGIFCPGNQGLQGIISFFQNHKCNYICKALKLEEFSYEICKQNIEDIEQYMKEDFEKSFEFQEKKEKEKDLQESQLSETMSQFIQFSEIQFPKFEQKNSKITIVKPKFKQNDTIMAQKYQNTKNNLKIFTNNYMEEVPGKNKNIVQSNKKKEQEKEIKKEVNLGKKKDPIKLPQIPPKVVIKTSDNFKDFKTNNKNNKNQQQQQNKIGKQINNTIYGQNNKTSFLSSVKPNNQVKDYQYEYEDIQEDILSATCESNSTEIEDLVVYARSPKYLKKIK